MDNKILETIGKLLITGVQRDEKADRKAERERMEALGKGIAAGLRGEPILLSDTVKVTGGENE